MRCLFRQSLIWCVFVIDVSHGWSLSSCQPLIHSSFSADYIPLAPLLNSNLSICDTSLPTCCTREVEQKMLSHMKGEVLHSVQDRVIVLKHIFDQHFHSFDKHNRGAISSSREQLHAMFTTTYGLFYRSHAQIFGGFFDSLEQFYTNQTFSSMKTILDDFFFILFRTMFSIMNPLEKVTKSDYDCLRGSMSSIQPFGDIPNKMTIQLERSVRTAKSLTRALRSTSDILQSILKKELSDSCAIAATRVTHCSQCMQKSARKPCSNLCLNVFKGCLAEYVSLDEPWNVLVDTLTKLANRLKGPYNVISVVVPIGVQISESIMLFQENDHQISAKVIQKCFKNSNKQLIKKRDIDKSQLSPNITITSTQLQLSEPDSSVNTQMMISFIDRLATTRGFWRSLSKSICIDGEWAESASGDVPCWNGTHLSDYNRPLVGDGIRNQMLNPEFDSSNNLSSEAFVNEVLKISMLSNQLADIYEERHLRDANSEREGSGSQLLYSPVDDEDSEDGSGSDTNLAVVIDIAGSHRDVEVVVPTVVEQPKIDVVPIESGSLYRLDCRHFVSKLTFTFLLFLSVFMQT